MANVIKFEDLPVEALTEVAKETFEEALWATEKALAKQLEFGRVMLIVKSKLPYGEWGNWVRETFQDQMSLRNIQFHMKAHQEVAKNPSLLGCANSLDEILTLTEKPRKPSVEVIEVAADVPVADEIVTEDEPAVEVITAVETVKPAAAKPASPQQVSPPPERKPPSVQQIESRLMRLGKDKKKHDQLMQVAKIALHYLTEKERVDWLSSQLMRMSDADRIAVFRDVNLRISGVITE